MEDTSPAFVCPCCDGLLATLEGPPVLFVPCGHTVCPSCAEAVSLCPPDGSAGTCCVCDSAIHTTVFNTQLVALGSDDRQETQDVGAAVNDGPKAAADLTSSPFRCGRHPDKELLFVCEEFGTALCSVCAGEYNGFTAPKLVPFADGAAPALELLLEEFESTVIRANRVEATATCGAANVVTAGETAALQTKEVFASLRESLDRQEARLLQAVGAETRRRAKVLEAQATELAVTRTQTQAVVRMGQSALASADPAAIARAHKLAHASRGLLDPHLALKASPALEARLDVDGICRILEAAVVAAEDDPTYACALEYHSHSRRHLDPSCSYTAAEWARLVATSSLYLHTPPSGTVFCRAAAVYFKHMLVEPGWDGCRCQFGQAYRDLLRAMPPAGCLDDAWCEAWCEALACLGDFENFPRCLAAELNAGILRVLERAGTEGVRMTSLAWEVICPFLRSVGVVALADHDALDEAVIPAISAAFGSFAEDPDALCMVLHGAAHLRRLGISLFPMVFESMRKHPDHERLQVWGLKFLVGGYRGKVFSALLEDGFRVPLAVLARHQNSSMVRHAGVNCLARVFAGTYEARAVISARPDGAVLLKTLAEAVELAISQPCTPDVMVDGTLVLAIVSPSLPSLASLDTTSVFLERQAVASIVPLLHSTSAADVVRGMWWGGLVIANSEIGSNLELRESARRAVATHPDNEAVQCVWLTNFCKNVRLEPADAPHIFNAMDSFPQTALIHSAGFRALRYIFNKSVIMNDHILDRAHTFVVAGRLSLAPPLVESVAWCLQHPAAYNTQRFHEIVGVFCTVAQEFPWNHRMLRELLVLFEQAYHHGQNPALFAQMASVAVAAVRAHPTASDVRCCFTRLETSPPSSDYIAAALLVPPP